jgi:Mitogen-activated protein kinase kinase 1 interacting
MAAVTLLPASLQNALKEIVERSNRSAAGIRVILLSTSEGVPLGRIFANDQPLNEDALASIESVWAPASKQFPVLGLDKVQQVTAIYDHGTLIHVYQTPVVRQTKTNHIFDFMTKFT